MALPRGSRPTCIDHKPTIDVLNVHEGVIPSKHKEFIKLFKESGYEGYLNDGSDLCVLVLFNVREMRVDGEF